MKIALFGDSFSSRVHDPHTSGWPILLEKHFSIENFSQSGSSQYRILKSLKNQNLSLYDKIVVSHTSPLRVFVRFNPLHQATKYHKNCDLIFSDSADRDDQFSIACQLFYKHIFDIEHAFDIHNMICREINDVTSAHDTLHITHFDYDGLYRFDGMINFYQHWLNHKGDVNHYNQQGNNVVYQELLKHLI
jgi:hypothetical protein